MNGIRLLVPDRSRSRAPTSGNTAILRLLPDDTVFFNQGAPGTRKLFVRHASGRVTRMIDRRDGRDIVWTRSENP